MKIPTRPAPSVPRGEPSRDNYYQSKKPVGEVKPKKKPPPRPPPPKFNNNKSDFTTSLIDLSAPLDDYLQATSTSNDNFLKPVSNNIFSSNPCSREDFSKISLNNSTDFFKPKPTTLSSNYTIGNSSFFGNNSVNYLDLSTGTETVGPKTNVVPPTIIRAQPKTKRDFGAFQINDVSRNDIEANNYSPPMPTIPPPSPPKCIYDNGSAFDENLPHGIALYNYPATHKDDLSLQVNDIVYLLHQINEEWLYGKIGDAEGMFPANFIDIRVPLPNVQDNLVTALYQFNPETAEDLKLMPGQKVKVLKRISQDWLYGESNGCFGQFPVNFIDRIPANL